MEYRIQQKATNWYETFVEAESFEEAISKIEANQENYDWELKLDTTDMLDEFWAEDENGEEFEKGAN
jgi:hypothetical protein